MAKKPPPFHLLHPEGPFVDRLQRLLGERFDLRIHGSWEPLLRDMHSAPPFTMVVVDPHMGREELIGPAPELQRLLEEHPLAIVIAALYADAGDPRTAHTLRKWGVTEIIEADDGVTDSLIRRSLRTARVGPLRDLVNGPLSVPRPGRARMILRAAVDGLSTGVPQRPPQLADDLGVTSETLLRWCNSSGLPTPRRLLIWVRTLMAASLLDDPGQTQFEAAWISGYNSDNALANALRRVVPLTPGELRRRGAFRTLSQAFLDEVGSA